MLRAGDIGQKRVEELIARLTEAEVRRPQYEWDNLRDWVENAERENNVRPFHAILSRDNPRDHPNVVRADDILDGTSNAWHVRNSIVVERNATSMAHGVEPMLRSAKQILFVDPHFRASRPRYRNSLRGFLRLVRIGEPPVMIEFHAGHVANDAPNWDFFRQECEHHLPNLIPADLTLTVRRWTNRTGGERLHNRYVLTDIGGVQFGAGLDEGDPGTTDDLIRLDFDAYRQRIKDYSGNAPAFALEGEVLIPGLRPR